MTNKFGRKPPMEISGAYQVFFEAINQGSLEAMVRAAWEVFGLPVMLIDKNDQPVCQWPDKPLGFAMWDRYYHKDPLEPQEREDSRIKALSGKPPVFAPFLLSLDHTGENDVFFGQIQYDGLHYGYFAVYLFGNEPDGEDLKRAEIFSKALGTVFYYLRGVEQESLGGMLLDLLAEESSEPLRTRAASGLGRQIKGSYTVLVKPIGPDASSSTFAVASLKHIGEMGWNVVAAIHGGCFVVLRGGTHKETGAMKEELGRIEAYLRPAGLGCGVSAPFKDLFGVKAAFQQAHMAALCGQGVLSFYEEVVPAPIFRLVVHCGDGNAFCHPGLEELWQYDQKHKTEYFKTLRAYSLFLHDKDRAAEELCVHRNTVVYRLNRIEEIFGLPYEEPRTALHLLNSFQLWDVMKKE